MKNRTSFNVYDYTSLVTPKPIFTDQKPEGLDVILACTTERFAWHVSARLQKLFGPGTYRVIYRPAWAENVTEYKVASLLELSNEGDITYFDYDLYDADYIRKRIPQLSVVSG